MPGVLIPIVIVKENVSLTLDLKERLLAALKEVEGCNSVTVFTLSDSSEIHCNRYISLASKPLYDTDLIIGAKVMDIAEKQMMSVINDVIDSVLQGIDSESTELPYRFVREAALQDPSLNLAVIDLEESYAIREAHSSLKAGLNVMIQPRLTDSEASLQLKQLAADSGLLFIGSGAGASVINGASLGPFNHFSSGSISLLGVSSVALQELTVICDRLGMGIRHALCVGDLDLTQSHAALSIKNTLQLLDSDTETTDILLVLPACELAIQRSLIDLCSRLSKPVYMAIPNSEVNLVNYSKLRESTVDMMMLFSEDKSMSSSVLYPRAFPKLDLKEQQHKMLGFFVSDYNRKEASSIIGDSYSFKSYMTDLNLSYELDNPKRLFSAWLDDLELALNSAETASILCDLIVCDGIDTFYIDRFFDIIQQGAYSDFITVICSIVATSSDTYSYSSLSKRCRDSGVIVAASSQRAAFMAKQVWSDAKVGVVHAIVE